MPAPGSRHNDSLYRLLRSQRDKPLRQYPHRHAASLENALDTAIANADDDSFWISTDCGPTFIDAAAPGEDVDPWNPQIGLTVPYRFTEAVIQGHGPSKEFLSVLNDLIQWAKFMGRWNSPTWERAHPQPLDRRTLISIDSGAQG